MGWNPYCIANWLCEAHISPLSITKPEPSMDLSTIPLEYHDLGQVFCKAGATSLPVHRPYECTIELLPCTTQPRGHLFSLSRSETESTKKYIQQSLAGGIIYPSSPAGAGCFYVGKTDGCLHPCIDYRGLNDITVFTKFDHQRM